jgi:hypothetical protein
MDNFIDTYEKRKTDLYWALRTRVLTDEEMGEVAKHDYCLLIRSGEVYTPSEKIKEFGDALLQQFKIRHITSLTKAEEIE